MGGFEIGQKKMSSFLDVPLLKSSRLISNLRMIESTAWTLIRGGPTKVDFKVRGGLS